MAKFWLSVRLVIYAILALFLHYVLPQHDIVRITGTEILRTDLSGPNAIFYAQGDYGTANTTTRDVRLINTIRQKTMFLGLIRRDATETMVYRNEDTGWIWPPYFKFDSSDLQAEAQDYTSTAAAPEWVVVRHYGWRNGFFSIYPNAVKIWPIADDRPVGERLTPPDTRIIPWFNILVFIGLGVLIGFIRLSWRQFREGRIDPATKEVAQRFDGLGAAATTNKGRIRAWFKSWRH